MSSQEQFRVVQLDGYREIELYEADSLEELADYLNDKGGHQ